MNIGNVEAKMLLLEKLATPRVLRDKNIPSKPCVLQAIRTRCESSGLWPAHERQE